MKTLVQEEIKFFAISGGGTLTDTILQKLTNTGRAVIFFFWYTDLSIMFLNGFKPFLKRDKK